MAPPERVKTAILADDPAAGESIFTAGPAAPRSQTGGSRTSTGPRSRNSAPGGGCSEGCNRFSLPGAFTTTPASRNIFMCCDADDGDTCALFTKWMIGSVPCRPNSRSMINRVRSPSTVPSTFRFPLHRSTGTFNGTVSGSDSASADSMSLLAEGKRGSGIRKSGKM